MFQAVKFIDFKLSTKSKLCCCHWLLFGASGTFCKDEALLQWSEGVCSKNQHATFDWSGPMWQSNWCSAEPSCSIIWSEIMWGGISPTGKTRLVITGGNLNAKKYWDEILQPVAVCTVWGQTLTFKMTTLAPYRAGFYQRLPPELGSGEDVTTWQQPSAWAHAREGYKDPNGLKMFMIKTIFPLGRRVHAGNGTVQPINRSTLSRASVQMDGLVINVQISIEVRAAAVSSSQSTCCFTPRPAIKYPGAEELQWLRMFWIRTLSWVKEIPEPSTTGKHIEISTSLTARTPNCEKRMFRLKIGSFCFLSKAGNGVSQVLVMNAAVFVSERWLTEHLWLVDH